MCDIEARVRNANDVYFGICIHAATITSRLRTLGWFDFNSMRIKKNICINSMNALKCILLGANEFYLNTKLMGGFRFGASHSSSDLSKSKRF